MDASIQKLSLLSDSKLESDVGLSWQMHINQNVSIVSEIELQYGTYNVNKMLHTASYSDPLSLPQSFGQIGAGATMGIFHKHFWLIGKYTQNFMLTIPEQHAAYLGKSVYITTGMRFTTKNWEVSVPIQLNNALAFNVTQLNFGSYLAYKHNYLLFKTNTLWDMDFELSILPYNWLRVGIVYQIHQQSSLSSYGTTGSYLWKSQKLKL